MKETDIIKIIKRKSMVKDGAYDGRFKTKTHKSKRDYRRHKKHKKKDEQNN